jgi:cell division septal protein FtsQ
VAGQRRALRRRRLARRIVRLLGRVLGVALAVGAVGVTGAAALHGIRTAPAFAVAAIDVVGTRRVPEADVVAASRVEPGTNLFALDPEAIEDRVEALPGVRGVRVIRRLPNRVTLLVEEREPYALVNAVGGAGLVWVDALGHLVGPERRPASLRLPVLSGVELPAGGPDAPIPDRLRDGLTLLRAIERSGPRVAERVSEIDMAGPGGPTLYTVDHVSVQLGPDRWDERLARLDGVLADLEDRGERVERIDLRFRDQVVLRPGPAAAPPPVRKR